MKKDNKYINHSDPFSKAVKQKLEDHILPVDKDLWGAIEKKMLSKRNYKPVWISIGITASIALLTIIVFPFKKENDTQLPLLLTEQSHTIETTNREQENKITFSKKESKNFTKNNSDIKEEVVTSEYITDEQNLHVNTLLPQNNYSEDTIPEDVHEEIFIYDTIPTHNDFIIHPKKTTNQLALNINSYRKIETHKSSWLIGPSFSALGSGFDINLDLKSDNDISDIDPPTSPEEPSEELPPNQNKFDPNKAIPLQEFTQKKYFRPLSFGLLIQKKINNYIALESGLVFTYISSNFEKNADTYTAKSKLDLYYLGVPFNLRIIFSNRPKWDFYLSTGVMVEKGLQSVHSQEIYFENQSYNNKFKEPVKNFQWSIHGALGTSYKFSKNAEVYLEPKLSLYFDNEQPTSIRTEHIFTFGMNFGLRYKL